MSIPKKIFIISSVLLATVLFFMAIYNISFKGDKITNKSAEKDTPKKEEIDQSEKKGGEKLVKNKEKIYSLSNQAVISPVLTDNGEKIIYYTRLSGSVYKVNLNGEGEELVDDNNFIGLENIAWSADRNKVVSSFNENGKINYFFYSYLTKKASRLVSGIEDIAWSSSGDRIVYKYADSKTGKKTLNIAEADGSNWKKIADISQSNVSIVSVPQSSIISFWNKPNSFEETYFSTVSIIGGDPKKAFSGRFGADYLWSSNGARVLVSSADIKGGSKIQLAIINSNGGEYQNLNVPTFVSKCVWSGDGKAIYYALPSFSSENFVLPNDYLSKKVTSRDTFWKMDINTGKAERIVEPGDIKNSYDATNLFLSPAEDILFFVNRIDGRLYGINL